MQFVELRDPAQPAQHIRTQSITCIYSKASARKDMHLEAVGQAAGTPVGLHQQLQVLLHVCCRGSRGGRLQNHIHLRLHASSVQNIGYETEGNQGEGLQPAPYP